MDKLYTIIEVATKLNLSDKTLRRWEEAGKFTPTRTLGNQRRYSIEDLQILDAIKHGTINAQKDLLTIDQAAKFCGVSPATIIRYEENGKIHPLITSGNTYYPRQKLEARMDELKKIYVEPEPVPDTPGSQGAHLPHTPGVKGSHTPGVFTVPLLATSPLIHYSSFIIHTFITIFLLLSYHLLFNQPTPPVSPQVQGASISTVDPRLDDLITKFNDHLSSEMLKNAKPVPVTTINLTGASLITGTATLSQGKNQISLTHEKITPLTPVTLTFTSDYSPAKKYWVTSGQGSFTLTTDFPVSADSLFNYSAIIKP